MNCDVLNIKLENSTVYKQTVTMFDQQTANTVVKTPKYGRLYNFYAVVNANFAPDGYRVPTIDDYTALSTYLGGTATDGGKLKEAGLAHWLTPNTDATNETKFTALPGGKRNYNDGVFNELTNICRLWTSSIDGIYGDHVYMSWDSGVLNLYYGIEKNYGFSVRLIKNSSDWTQDETLTDLDGNVYNTIKIGNQVWLAQNWACTKLNNGTAIPEITDNTDWTTDVSGAYCNYNNDETDVFDIVNYVTVTNTQGDTLTNTQLYNSVQSKPMLVNRIVFYSSAAAQKYNSLKCVKTTITGESVSYNINFYEYVNPLYPNNVIEINLKEPVYINAEEYLKLSLEANSETSILLEYCQQTNDGIVQELIDSVSGFLGYDENDIIHIEEDDTGSTDIDNSNDINQKAGISPFCFLLFILAAIATYKIFKK